MYALIINKSTLKSGNACYHSVQNLLYSSLFSKNIQIKIYRNIILLVVGKGVKLGRSHLGRNVDRGNLRIGYRGEYWAKEGRDKRRVEKTTQ
jgi:hypothetical protein